jgi:RNA polymerase sigma-70 factor (ECF subfamily)
MTNSSPDKPINRESRSGNAESEFRLSQLGSNRVAAADRGPAAAFDGLWRSYSKRILRTTYRITRNHEDAEDALQDAFLRAYVHLQDFDGRSSFLTWLTRIAINSASMILRKRHSAVEVSIDDSVGRDSKPSVIEVADRSPGPEARYAQREQEVLLRESIAALPPTTRKAVQLRKIEERSLPETATMMGVSLNAAKTRIYRAKESLRASLKPRMAAPARSTRKFSFGS